MRATRGWHKTTGCDATHSPGCCGRAVAAEPLPVPHRPPRFVRRRGRTAAQPARRHGGIRRTAPPDARGRHAGRADQPSSTRDASYSAGGGHPNAHPALLLSPRTGRLPQPQSRRHGETPPTLRTQPQPHAPARTSIAVGSGGGGGGGADGAAGRDPPRCQSSSQGRRRGAALPAPRPTTPPTGTARGANCGARRGPLPPAHPPVTLLFPPLASYPLCSFLPPPPLVRIPPSEDRPGQEEEKRGGVR